MEGLTAKERYLRMFRGEPIDRIPVCPRVFENVVFEYFKTRDLEPEYLERIFDYYRAFGFDIIDWNCNPQPRYYDREDFVLEGAGWNPTVTEEVHGPSKHVIATVDTPKGQLRRVLGVTQIGEWEEEVALVEYPIKTERDFDIMAEFMPAPHPLDTDSSLKKANELIGDDGITSASLHGPFNILAYCYRKADDLFLDPLMRPDFYHNMMEFFLDRLMQYGQQMIDGGTHMADIGTNVANSLVVSPDFLIEHILPYENRLADLFQNQGVPALYHNCGHAAKHLHIYNQLHHRLWGYLAPAPHGDTVLEEAIEKVPRDMILWGHIDQIDFLRRATPEEVEARVKYICETIKPRGNFILGTTDYLETNTPPANIRALVEAGHKYGRYDN